MVRMKWFALALLLMMPRQQGMAQQPASEVAAEVGGTPESSGAEAMDEEIDHAAAEEVGPTQPEAPASIIESFFNDLNASTVSQKVEAMMAPTVVYEDPFGRFEGRDKAMAHLQGILGGMQTINVDVKEEFVSGEETVAIWTMTLTNKRLKSGDPVVFDGVTRVKMQGDKIVMQTSQFDLGAAFYENVPVVGWLVRWVKGKAES